MMSLPVCLSLLSLLLLNSCTLYHKQWRTDFSPAPLQASITAKDRTAAAERKNRVLEVYGDRMIMAHVEYTDQGGFWKEGKSPENLSQLEALEKWVADDLRKDPAKYRKGAIILTFTHGWHNNAAEGNANLANFRKSLQKGEQQDVLNRPVIGVYLSWRGRIRLKTPGVDAVELLTTFWGRKEAAERIGYRGMAETLMRLSLLRDTVAKAERSGGRPVEEKDMNSRLIVVGHSFGAQAVFSAISRFFEDELMEITLGKTRKSYVDRRWDFVVLVNPAFEAHRYDIIDRYQRLLKYDRFYTRLPRMLIVGSASDRPNQRIFPIGQRLDSRTWAVQKGEYEIVSQTAGQLPHYLTHDLKYTGPDSTPLLVPRADYPFSGRSRLPAFAAFREVTTEPLSIQPFMVARADSEVVKGHGGIWKDEFRRFLISLLTCREKAVQAYKKSGS